MCQDSTALKLTSYNRTLYALDAENRQAYISDHDLFINTFFRVISRHIKRGECTEQTFSTYN